MRMTKLGRPVLRGTSVVGSTSLRRENCMLYFPQSPIDSIYNEEDDIELGVSCLQRLGLFQQFFISESNTVNSLFLVDYSSIATRNKLFTVLDSAMKNIEV